MSHPLATRHGIEFVLAFLVGTGGLCVVCNYGTRVTSKRWAKCKKCGARIQRFSDEDWQEGLKVNTARLSPAPPEETK